LKPAHEPIVVARKPLQGTVAGNVLVWGTGGLNIDGCRVGTEGATTRGDGGGRLSAQGAFTTGHAIEQVNAGRWPANIVLDGAAAAALDQQTGYQKDGTSVHRNRPETGSSYDTDWGVHKRKPRKADHTYGGGGGGSRYFTQADFGPDDWPFVYQAKPSKRERNAGLDGLPEGPRVHMGSGGRTLKDGVWVETHSEPQPRANHHPTVKPVALMRHLVRLVTPPGGTVLDPFAGSGTTLVAAVLEGMHAIGCEMTDEYLPIIRGRVAWAEQQADAEQPRLL
jgi:site-specific DNA-methyltransferase (adenine-specific)